MKKVFSIAIFAICALLSNAEERVLTIFDQVVFYDGYNGTVMDADLDDGILRHRNSLYAVKLTPEQLASIGTKFSIDITVGALCDNYDRIGNINLSLVPKGEETYDPFAVTRLELCRFITPFMNMNKEPREVPYHFDVDYLSYIFHDSRLLDRYDYWVEFELFGVPYAANEQVTGCAGRNDVFEGTLRFITDDTPMAVSDVEEMESLVMKRPEYMGHNLNNYSEQGTDTIGKCTKTYRFNLENSVEDGHVVFIISNHGANALGEEYNRRLHLLYFDDELVLTYIPGETSCEPYRVYNTQANGIYGRRPKTDEQWQSFSNWCPGAAIPIRYLHIGPVAAGEHKVMVRVPDALFRTEQGDFPVSMFFQGLKEGTLPAGVRATVADNLPDIQFTRRGDVIEASAESPVIELQLITIDGRMAAKLTGESSINLKGFERGEYILAAFCLDGSMTARKIVR